MGLNKALLQALPLHLQYLDSLLYRRFYYDPAKGEIKDPRVTDPRVEEAVLKSIGSIDNPAAYGWIKLLLTPEEITEAQLVEIIQRIWPTYLSLYEEAMREEERWRAYQHKMKEEKKQAIREEFKQLSQQALGQLDEYLKNLPQETKQAIQKAVEEAMNQAMEQFTCPGASSMSRW